MHLRDSRNKDGNHYTWPLPICPVIDAREYKVTRIDILPTGADHRVRPPGPWQPTPANEYTPEHNDLRSDLKPLHVVQPEGASFQVSSMGGIGAEVIQWQKWFFRVSFNCREGMVISDVGIS